MEKKHTWLSNWNKSWIICLSVCGSIRQGSCSKYELRNISSDNVDFLPEAVAANDAVSTTFAFIGPQRYNRWGQGNVLYVGTTYTPHGDYRHDVPAISSRNLINLRFAEYSVSKQVIRLLNPSIIKGQLILKGLVGILNSPKKQTKKFDLQYMVRTYLQLPSRQWDTGNVYLLVLSSWKVNIVANPIAVMGL